MNMETKNNIFKRYLTEYLKANKKRKSEILNHCVDVVGMHRKAAVRKFKILQLRDGRLAKGRGRSVYYTKDVDAALFDVWDAAHQACGELLSPMIKEYVAILIRDKMWNHGDEATRKLQRLHTKECRAQRCE